MTDRPLNRKLVRLAAQALLWAVQVIPMGGCEHEDLAGTSVGTGNPGMVTLGFVEGSTAARVSGHVFLYTTGHNPLVDSLPLASFEVEDRDSLELPLDALVPLLRRAAFASDTFYTVNILLRTADGRGGWLPAVAFPSGSDRHLSMVPGSRIDFPVVPLDSFRGTVAGEDAEGERHYLTLFGSPFFGRVDGRGFALDSIPRGRYEARLVRFLEEAPIIGDIKPAPVHALGDSLDTQGTGAITLLPDILGMVPLPIGGPRERP